MELKSYQFAQYKDGGRGNGFYDCWGLVREVANKFYDYPLFSSFGDISVDNKKQMTKAAFSVMRGLKECELHEGAIVAGYTNGLMIHVGIVVKSDDKLQVLHATSKSGIVINSIRQFERLAGKEIKYYDR